MDGYNTLDAEGTFGLCAFKKKSFQMSHIRGWTNARSAGGAHPAHTSHKHTLPVRGGTLSLTRTLDFPYKGMKADITDLYFCQQSAFTRVFRVT